MYQKIFIIGRLGRDPEMRFTPGGSPVTTFSVATDRQYPGADGALVKETAWFKVAAWGKLAESCNTYLAKGKLVAVEGRLNVDGATGGPRTWVGKDNTVHAAFEMTAMTVRFLSPSEKAVADASAEEPDQIEDIPF